MGWDVEKKKKNRAGWGTGSASGIGGSTVVAVGQQGMHHAWRFIVLFIITFMAHPTT
jgi:hypothetical protein